MKKLDRQRKITLAVLSMALVIAVYLNWQYTRTGADVHIMADDAEVLNQELNEVISQQNINSQGDMLISASETIDEETSRNYGDAQLIATTEKSAQKYFVETRLSRKKSRDEALDVLQKHLKTQKYQMKKKHRQQKSCQ